MKILSPAMNAAEVRAVVDAGAHEIYCGVMPSAWSRTYSNVASPNRREWRVSNISGFDTLESLVAAAHEKGVPVFLTMNALYTTGQYPMVEELVRGADRAGVDALIVADLGLMLELPRMGWTRQVHVSTGGTSFNGEAVRFWKDLGATRVILDRQHRISEVAKRVADNPDVEIETFILNRGCMNIDGFCTYHHGVNEIDIPLWWNIPKMLHLDYYFLALMKRVPQAVRTRMVKAFDIRTDSACLLLWDIEVAPGQEPAGATDDGRQALARNLRRNFNVFAGADTCGACALWDLKRAGVASLKIVGRSNPLHKKLKDVRLLADCLGFLECAAPDREEFRRFARERYRKVYGFGCDDWCYYPEEDRAITAEAL